MKCEIRISYSPIKECSLIKIILTVKKNSKKTELQLPICNLRITDTFGNKFLHEIRRFCEFTFVFSTGLWHAKICSLVGSINFAKTLSNRCLVKSKLFPCARYWTNLQTHIYDTNRDWVVWEVSTILRNSLMLENVLKPLKYGRILRQDWSISIQLVSMLQQGVISCKLLAVFTSQRV